VGHSSGLRWSAATGMLFRPANRNDTSSEIITAMGAPLLVTAFEPFGPIRGNVPGLKGNRSQDLLRALEPVCRNHGLTLQVLPVSPGCIGVLDHRLQEGPRGALLMGEDLVASFRIEQSATDPAAQFGPIRLLGAERRTSSFVGRLARNVEDAPVTNSIGTYYCNKVYWHALGWAAEHGDAPVAFVHVGPFVRIEAQLDELTRLIGAM
jgi:hypothetical protein